MPRTAAQFDRIREQSREKILQSALTLFAQHGFAATSVRMIAQAAGISQGLLYNYFESKQVLLRAIFERSMEDVGEDLEAASRAAPAEAAVALLVRSAFETLRANPDFWRLTYQLRMQSEVLTNLDDQAGAWADAIRLRIEQLLERARVPGSAIRARVLFAAIDGAAQHYVLDMDGYPLDAVADELIRLLAPGASAPEPPPSDRERT